MTDKFFVIIEQCHTDKQSVRLHSAVPGETSMLVLSIRRAPVGIAGKKRDKKRLSASLRPLLNRRRCCPRGPAAR
jgi:hypothetical protein